MFFHPHILWLLIIPILLLAWQVMTTSAQTRNKIITPAVLRFLALTLIIIAVARPFKQSDDDKIQVVAIIDCSSSMDPASIESATKKVNELSNKFGLDSLSLIIVDSSAREVSLENGIPSASDIIKLRSEKPGSVIADALALSAALCPNSNDSEIHLFSDGRQTHGNINSAAADIGKRGIKLITHTVGSTANAETLLLGINAPSTASVGENTPLFVTIDSKNIINSVAQITDPSGKVISSSKITLSKGLNNIALTIRPKESGLRQYNITLDGNNKTLSAYIKVNQSILGILESAPKAPATAVLTAMIGSQTKIKPLKPTDITPDSLKTIDTLVIADTPIKELSSPQQLAIKSWVENGGGLLVSGGKNTFGPGGFEDSTLASILPLKFPQKKEARDPSTAVAIIIDTSGSMGLEGVSLAKEVARLSLKRLKPHDKAGIVEFHGAKRWAAPIQSAGNNIAIQRAINRLAAGGATVMYPALEEAHYGLLNVRARTKHVLILTDAGVEQGAFETQLRRMADDGIHVSTVLIGPRAGAGFLSKLASWGRGQFYSAPNRFQIPEIIVKQPSGSLLDSFVENEQKIQTALTSQLTKDLSLKDAPTLRGYAKAKPKKSSELILRSSRGDPILSRWNYGLGRVAVLTTALGGKWSNDFFQWPAAASLLANITRQLTGVSQRNPIKLQINQSHAGIDLSILSLSSDNIPSSTALNITVNDTNGNTITKQTISPVKAQTWNTRINNPEPGNYTIQIANATSNEILADGAVSIPKTDEFTSIEPNDTALAKATTIANAFKTKALPSTQAMQARELWPLFTSLSIICFIIMILTRRLPENPLTSLFNK